MVWALNGGCYFFLSFDSVHIWFFHNSLHLRYWITLSVSY